MGRAVRQRVTRCSGGDTPYKRSGTRPTLSTDTAIHHECSTKSGRVYGEFVSWIVIYYFSFIVVSFLFFVFISTLRTSPPSAKFCIFLTTVFIGMLMTKRQWKDYTDFIHFLTIDWLIVWYAIDSHTDRMPLINTQYTLQEMQDKPLPLDVQLLAKRAESRNMFAKCLRYREQEFNSLNVLPSGECIEALISVNNELGLPERATGVLHYVNQHYSHISIEPQWLQKLCHWERARQSYLQQNLKWIESYPDDRPPKHPSWMAGEIGTHLSWHLESF